MNWEKLKNHQLKVYSTAWCSDCVVLKKLFLEKGIVFTDIDIDENPAAATELKAATGETSIPWVNVDNKFFVRGWHRGEPGSWSDKLFFNDIEENL